MKTLAKLVAVVAVLVSVAFSAKAERRVSGVNLPETAQMFIEKNYASIGIRECERDDDGHYDVELLNGVDMEFSESGKLLKIDAGRLKVSKSILKEILPEKAYNELETRKVVSKVEEVEINRYNIKVDLRQMWNDELIFDLDGNFQSVSD